jgi:peroxiredoxin 2/4
MKKSLILLLLAFSLTHVWAQEDRNFKIPLIGDIAPSFTAETTTGKLNFPSSFGKTWKILLSHPQDFTPVCSSELLELAHLQKDFDDLNVKLVIVSTDKLETHHQWVKSLEEVKYKNRESQKIRFPLIDDNDLTVSKLYGMIHASSNSTKNVRGVYIIDPDNVIQSVSFYPMLIGRNMDELKRTIIALQTAKEDEILTPANWLPGDDVIVPYKRTANEDGLYDVVWYMTFKRI